MLRHFTDTIGKPTDSKRKSTSRQQLHADDHPKLAKLLEFKSVKKYDVYVMELYESNLSKEGLNSLKGGKPNKDQTISICGQLLDHLIWLENTKQCHNDLKPENVLVNNYQGKITVVLGDFGEVGKKGGTPGWTWPKYLSKRLPGKSDAYSVALLILYVMCDNREVFYRIRNNYIEKEQCERWLDKFRNDSFFNFIIDMMNLKLTPKEAKDRWDQISRQVQIIDKDYLWQNFGVEQQWLRAQYGMDSAQGLNLVRDHRLYCIFNARSFLFFFSELFFDNNLSLVIRFQSVVTD